MTDAFAFWATPEADLVHPAETIQRLLEKVRRYRVNIDGNVCTAMVTTLVLEVWSDRFFLYSRVCISSFHYYISFSFSKMEER